MLIIFCFCLTFVFIFVDYTSALHFNKNNSLGQAVTSDGKPQFGISYPKCRKGDAIAKKVVTQTFGMLYLYWLIMFMKIKISQLKNIYMQEEFKDIKG